METRRRLSFSLKISLILLSAILRGEPSQYYLSCVEDCMLSIGKDFEATEKFASLFPKLAYVQQKGRPVNPLPAIRSMRINIATSPLNNAIAKLQKNEA